MPFNDSPASLTLHCIVLNNLICLSTREPLKSASMQCKEFSLAYMKGIKDWIALNGKVPSFPLGVGPELIHAMHSVGKALTEKKKRFLKSKGNSYQRQWFLDKVLFSGILHYLCMQISL